MKYVEPCLNCKFLLEYGCQAYPDGIIDEALNKKVLKKIII